MISNHFLLLMFIATCVEAVPQKEIQSHAAPEPYTAIFKAHCLDGDIRDDEEDYEKDDIECVSGTLSAAGLTLSFTGFMDLQNGDILFYLFFIFNGDNKEIFSKLLAERKVQLPINGKISLNDGGSFKQLLKELQNVKYAQSKMRS